MTREQRLVTLAALIFVLLCVLVLARVASAEPPSHLGHISERLFADVPTPPGAADPRTVNPAGALRDPGRLLPGAPEHRAGAPLLPSASLPGAADSAPTAPGGDAAPAVGQPADRSAPRLALSGQATWYDAWYGPGMYAAVGSFRFGADPYPISVCTIAGGTSRCAVAFVRDFCRACADGRRLVDLSPEVWAALDMPLDLGVIRVTVEGMR